MQTESGVITNTQANVSRHLNEVNRINLGSFYTPAQYVELVGAWLIKYGVTNDWVIADLASGYGAFFDLQRIDALKKCRYIGNDIDSQAVQKGKDLFPNVMWFEQNTLENVCRERFNIAAEDHLVLVGNPPYNDVTSQANKKIKREQFAVDADIKARDIGLSFLLAYNKLRADYVAVLHPLSYLIKRTNFNAGRAFFANYTLLEQIVFPSSEFEGTSKASCFPVIVALYKRDALHSLTYEDVCAFHFRTVGGEEFSVNGFDYVTSEIAKYPHQERYTPEILFYTLRDINALKRSRTFLAERITNAIDVDPNKLSYYCYIDCFKRYAAVPYYLGNFNVPYDKEGFPEIAAAVIEIAKFYHPEIFGENPKPTEETISRVKEYISKSLTPEERNK